MHLCTHKRMNSIISSIKFISYQDSITEKEGANITTIKTMLLVLTLAALSMLPEVLAHAVASAN